jgi:hypothetical protein
MALCAWPTPRTPTGGAETAERKKELGRTESGGGDLSAAALLAVWPTDVTGCPSCGKPETTCRCDMEQIEAAATAENMDEDTAAPSETVLAAWPTPDCSDGNTRPNGKGGKIMMDVAMLCGWATPRAEDAESAGMRHGRGVADMLTAQAGQGMPLTAWQTPKASDGTARLHHPERSDGGQPNLDWQAAQAGQGIPLAGWQTPTAEDAGRDGSLKDYMNYVENGQTSGCRLRAQVHATGHAIPSSPAATEKRGVLNPAHSRWLMGYPAAWDSCGATAMQSCRKSPRRS